MAPVGSGFSFQVERCYALENANLEPCHEETPRRPPVSVFYSKPPSRQTQRPLSHLRRPELRPGPVTAIPRCKSPNIDRLAGARRALRQRATASIPLCGPSRASFMTGLYPDQTLVHGNAIYIRDTSSQRVTTSPQMFRRTRLLRHADRQDLPLQCAQAHRHRRARRSALLGLHHQSARPRQGRRGQDLQPHAPAASAARLSWLAADGTDAEQTDGIAATEAIRQLEQYAADGHPFYPGGRSLPAAHALRRAEEVLRPVSAREDRRSHACRRVTSTRFPNPARQSITRERRSRSTCPTTSPGRPSRPTTRPSPSPTPRSGASSTPSERTGSRRQHDRPLHLRPRLPHGRARALAEDDALRERHPRAADHRRPRREDRRADHGDCRPRWSTSTRPSPSCAGSNRPRTISGISLGPVLQDAEATPAHGCAHPVRQRIQPPHAPLPLHGMGRQRKRGQRNSTTTNPIPQELKNLAGNPAFAGRARELSKRLRQRISEARIKPAGLTQTPPKPKKRPKRSRERKL